MDEKLENLIEKLSMLLNSSDKTTVKKQAETITFCHINKSTNKPVICKKLERLPELPPRKVIIDKTSELVSKSQETKSTIKPSEPIQCKVRNVNVDFRNRSSSSVRTSFKNLGVEKVDPNSYAQKYQSCMVYQSQMPNIADEVKIIHGIPLAADLKSKYYMELEGDIHALEMIDLDKEGLSEYKSYLNKTNNEATKSTSNLCTLNKTTNEKSPVSNLNEQKGSKLTTSSSLISTNSSTSSISSDSSLNTNDSDLKRQTLSPIRKSAATPACLDAKTCLKLKPQIEIENNKTETKPVPIFKNITTKSNNNLSKLLNQPRNTIINLPNNLNRNSIRNNTIQKQVSFKDHNIVRHSIATIPDNILPLNDKGTPLPSTPLPAPVRAILNSISTLNNNNTADTLPNTPAAFSTPIPVVSLPPLPLPLSKTPPRQMSKSPMKPQQNKTQSKCKSPLKIGQTSLKQLLKVYLKKQFQNKELPDKAILTNLILKELNLPQHSRKEADNLVNSKIETSRQLILVK